MAQDMLKEGEGCFFRGNLHCHSNRSDGLLEGEDVATAYRAAGYDFVCISDHFEAEYGWQVTDTGQLRDEGFTTTVGAELSSPPWTDRNAYWGTAAGLPVDFEAPPAYNRAEAIERAAGCGAFVITLHPVLNNLPLAAAGGLPALEAVHAVEIYNHNMAAGAFPDHSIATVKRLLSNFRYTEEQGKRLHAPKAKKRSIAGTSPTAKNVAALFMLREERLNEEQKRYLKRLAASESAMADAHRFTQEFAEMVRGLKGEKLDEWLEQASSSEAVVRRRFAAKPEEGSRRGTSRSHRAVVQWPRGGLRPQAKTAQATGLWAC